MIKIQLLNRGLPYLVIVMLLLACFTYINSLFIKENYIPDISEIIKLTLAHSYYYQYTDEHKARNKDFYPPVYFVSSALMNNLGSGKFTVYKTIYTNLIYLLLTLVCIYLSCLKLSNNRIISTYSLLTFIAFPGTLYFIGRYSAEISVMAICILTFLIFSYCNGFKSNIASILLGLSCAFGMLCKWSFLLYMCMPITLNMIISFKTKDTKQIANILIFIIVFLSACLWWYILKFNFYKIVFCLNDSIKTECTGMANGYPFFVFHNFEQVIALCIKALSLPIFITLIVIGIFSYVLKKHSIIKLLWLWILPAVIIHIFMPTDCVPRYILPILPFAAILITISICAFKKGPLVLTALILLSLISNLGALNLEQKQTQNFTPRELLSNIMIDARKDSDSELIIGLDAFHDPFNIIQDLYFSLWLLKQKNKIGFKIFYKDVEMLKAARKKPDFKKYYNDFLRCDYILSGQKWPGWNKEFLFLKKYNVFMKDDFDQQSFIGDYYLFKKT